MLIPILLILVLATCAVGLVALHRCRGLERELAALRSDARVDLSTELRNHRAFTEDLDRELRRSERTGRPASVAVFGLPPALSAEEVAAEQERRVLTLARTLVAAVRAVDAAYRIGVTELAVILPETRARDGLIAVQRVRSRALDAGVGSVRAGIAEVGPGLDRHEVFRHAYAAMLAAGRDGSGSALVYSPEFEGNGEPQIPVPQGSGG